MSIFSKASLLRERLAEERAKDIVLPHDLQLCLNIRQSQTKLTKGATSGLALSLASSSQAQSSSQALVPFVAHGSHAAEGFESISSTEPIAFARAALQLTETRVAALPHAQRLVARSLRTHLTSAFTAFEDALEADPEEVHDALQRAIRLFPDAFGYFMELRVPNSKALTASFSEPIGWLDLIARSMEDEVLSGDCALTALLNASAKELGLDHTEFKETISQLELDPSVAVVESSPFANWLCQHPHALYHLLAFAGNDSRRINLAVAEIISFTPVLRNALDHHYPVLAKHTKDALWVAFCGANPFDAHNKEQKLWFSPDETTADEDEEEEEEEEEDDKGVSAGDKRKRV